MISASANAESGSVVRELALRRATREHERQPSEVGLAAAAFVAGSDCVQKIVRERQVQRRVDVVDEHDDRRRRVRQDYFPEKFDEPIFGDGIAVVPTRRPTSTSSSSSAATRFAMRRRPPVRSSPSCSTMPRRSTFATKVPAARSERACALQQARLADRSSDRARNTSAWLAMPARVGDPPCAPRSKNGPAEPDLRPRKTPRAGSH